jgi:glutamyl-tRNA synthetase
MQILEKNAYKYAIKNAFLHDGKASLQAVIGKIKALHPEVDIKKAVKAAKAAVKRVNGMRFEEIEKEYKKFEAEEGFELKPPEKSETLPKLPWAKHQKVVTRFAPNPNGLMHLGSARAAILSYEYARRYKGKFILRFDDTDPKVKTPIENAEELFKKDLSWLGCKVDETYFASDRLDIYKQYMKKLIEMGRAYVCTCDPEKWRAKIKQQMPCPCREKKPKEHMKRFEKMLKNEYKQGEAVLRIKTILSHRDPSVRDWWIAKVVDEPVHPRVPSTEHVWPSYNFASAIDDHLLGVTLIIRGQEHQQNETKQMFLYNYFGWEYPHTIYTGRVMLEGVTLSTSKIREGIESGLYSGWDDPRLGTIAALRRRGFRAETIRKIILSIGAKPNDTTIEWNTLVAINRKLIGEKSPRINALEEPFRLIVEYAPEKEIKFDSRSLKLNAGLQDFVVEKRFVSKVKAVIRLRNAYNVRIKKISTLQAFAEYAGDTKKQPIVPWVLEPIDMYITMPDASVQKKVVDKALKMKVDETYYIDELGFVRIDSVSEEKISAWFAHR